MYFLCAPEKFGYFQMIEDASSGHITFYSYLYSISQSPDPLFLFES
jgi:hypothetical protein